MGRLEKFLEGFKIDKKGVIYNKYGYGFNTSVKSGKATFQCMECGHKFKKKMGPRTFDVKCPKCHSTDVDIIDGP